MREKDKQVIRLSCHYAYMYLMKMNGVEHISYILITIMGSVDT